MPDIREEFEEHVITHWATDYSDFGDGLFSTLADGRYEYEFIQWDWETWQASRAALMKDHVPMPRQCPSWLEDAYDNACATDERAADWLSLPAYEAMLKAQEEALQQAGIEVKP